MSFTDGKPWIATAEDVKRRWSGGKDGKYFRCGLCGVKFKEGDTVRWQCTNDVPGAAGNPFVCVNCDGTKEQICEKRIVLASQFKTLCKIFHQDCSDCELR